MSDGWSDSRISKSIEIIKNVELLYPSLKYAILTHVSDRTCEAWVYTMLKNKVGLNSDEFDIVMNSLNDYDKALLESNVKHVISTIECE